MKWKILAGMVALAMLGGVAIEAAFEASGIIKGSLLARAIGAALWGFVLLGLASMPGVNLMQRQTEVALPGCGTKNCIFEARRPSVIMLDRDSTWYKEKFCPFCGVDWRA